MKKRPNGDWRAFLDQAARSTTNECIVGGGAARPNVHWQGRSMRASRYVWMVAHGNPGPENVLHTCDNELCVNVCHMYLGSQAQNVIDMISRGRQASPELTAHIGSANGRARLTEANVLEIRQRYGSQVGRVKRGAPNSQRLLAAEYGVGEATISRVVRGKGWEHVA